MPDVTFEDARDRAAHLKAMRQQMREGMVNASSKHAQAEGLLSLARRGNAADSLEKAARLLRSAAYDADKASKAARAIE